MARYLFHYAQLRVNLRRNNFPGYRHLFWTIDHAESKKIVYASSIFTKGTTWIVPLAFPLILIGDLIF